MLADGTVYCEYFHSLYGAAGIEPIVSRLEVTVSLVCPQTEV
jgi:hypothetical protein